MLVDYDTVLKCIYEMMFMIRIDAKEQCDKMNSTNCGSVLGIPAGNNQQQHTTLGTDSNSIEN
jgi:hypothetical protein